MNESRVMRLLRHLCEITALAKTHRHLSVMTFHVLMQWFSFFLSLAIHSLQHFLIAIINRVYVVGTSVLYGQDLFKNCNASRLSELLLITHLTQVCCASFTRLFSHHGWIASGWWRRLTDKVRMILRVPRCLRLEWNADVWDIFSLWLDRMAPSQNR